MTNADKVKKLRWWYRETQEQFADRLGVTRTTVANWEGGKEVPVIVMLLITTLAERDGCNLNGE
jgi:DNA-binding transcriptional regulator YiaG